MNRIKQIGVVGSAQDLDYSEQTAIMAAELGYEIARQQCALVFGAEKDCDSLPTIAARSARELGGLTIGITYDKGLDIYDPTSASIVIATGLIRGGGREMVEALCCDGLIAIAGGSGTLNEVAVAYQANIPVICMTGRGGWSDELAGRSLDARNRYQYPATDSASEAVQMLLSWIK